MDWEEAKRLLSPGGGLMKVGPTSGHLMELRERLYDEVREYTAQLLGFDAVGGNSLDGVSDRDFAIEFCAAAGIAGTASSAALKGTPATCRPAGGGNLGE